MATVWSIFFAVVLFTLAFAFFARELTHAAVCLATASHALTRVVEARTALHATID